MQQKFNQKQDLQSFSSNTCFLKRRMGLITLSKNECSIWAKKIVLALEYLQIVSQILIVCCDDYVYKTRESDEYLDKKYFFDIFTYFFKLINPSFLISFKESNATTASILCLVFAFSLLKLGLFGYIVYSAYNQKLEENSILACLWRRVYRLQGRILCFFVTSFSIRSLLGLENEGFHLYGIGRPGCIVLYSLLMAIEYAFSFYLETQFCYRLPSKSFLSSKGFQMQLVTLSQKIMLQIIQISFKASSLACLWVFTSINLLFCLLRSHIFYSTFSLYKIQALLSQSDFMSIVNSFSIACFFQTLLKAADYQYFDSNFPLILGIVLSVFIMKESREYLNQVFLSLLTQKCENYSPDLLIHKISLTVQLEKKMEIPKETNSKYDLDYLITKAEESRISDVFDIQSEEPQNDRRSMVLNFLEKLSERHPKNSLIKLHIAKVCAKKSELYARAIKISAELAKNSWSQNYITFSFLLEKIQKTITQTSTTGNTKLDLYEYVKSQLFFEELKNEISQQTQLTVDLCKNILQNVTDIGVIFDYAQAIHKHRVIIEKKMANSSSKIPELFLAPVKLWAEYQLVLDFSLHDYQKFNDINLSKYSKCDKHFKASDLVQENLYQETNAFLILSGQKMDNGQILFCNKALEDLCGTKLDSIFGSHVSSLFTSSLQAPFADIFRHLFENTKTSILNQTTRTFLKHKNGHITEVDFYLRIHPYITENLYLNMLIRPVPGRNESLVLRENGDVEGATKALQKKLNLNSSIVNIQALSTELARVNEAFNVGRKQSIVSKTMVDAPKLNLDRSSRKRNFSEAVKKNEILLTKTRALEIQALYNSDCQKVRISPLNGHDDRTPRDFIYDCQMCVMQYGCTTMKLLRLYEVIDKENGDSSPKRRGSLQSPQRILSVQPVLLKDKKDLSNLSFSSMADASENIDCEEIKQTEQLVTEWRIGQTVMTSEGNLLSPRTSRSDANLLSTRRNERRQQSPRNMPVSHILLSDQDEKIIQKQPKLKKMKSQHTSGYPTISYASTEIKLHKAFQKALNIKSYPRVLRVLYYVFYLILLMSFGSLIVLKLFSDMTYDNLTIKKDMLVCAQLRTFYVIRLQTTFRGGALQIAGTFVADNIAYLKINDLLDLSHSWIDGLTDANQKIVNKINYLESDIKSELFKRDIAVVGTYWNSSDPSSTQMTSFQAVDQTELTLQRIYNLEPSQIFSDIGYHLFTFIAINNLNDNVAKNLEISGLFIESVKRERNLLSLIMILNITILPILLAIIVFMLIYTIWRQYTAEKDYMLAFVKLHPQGVKALFNTLTKFQRRLNDEEKFDEKDVLKLLISPVAMAIYHKNQGSQSVKYSQIQKKYWGYTIQVLFYAMILVGIIIWNFVSAGKSANNIYKRQDQLQFANEISVTASLSYISYTELFASNNTALVNRQLPYNSLIDTMNHLDDIQDELKSIFLEDDNTYDPEIQALIYDSGCDDLQETFQEYCGYLEDKGLKTGLNYALTLFRLSVSNKPADYLNVNKTSLAVIVAKGLEGFDNLLWGSGTAAAKAQAIREIINAKLEKDISNGRTERTVILVIFVVSLVIVSVLMWKQILSRVSNVNNDFKKVLQVFPADFVLSNFLLKNFLMESSQDIGSF